MKRTTNNNYDPSTFHLTRRGMIVLGVLGVATTVGVVKLGGDYYSNLRVEQNQNAISDALFHGGYAEDNLRVRSGTVFYSAPNTLKGNPDGSHGLMDNSVEGGRFDGNGSEVAGTIERPILYKDPNGGKWWGYTMSPEDGRTANLANNIRWVRESDIRGSGVDGLGISPWESGQGSAPIHRVSMSDTQGFIRPLENGGSTTEQPVGIFGTA